MNANTHPIEFLIASLLNLLEFTCYIINEIAGFHKTSTNATQPTTWSGGESPSVAIQQFNDHIHSLTVKQLQQITGIKSSRYRKSDLIALAATY